ncbi:MAG: EAL domain-containing protein [Pseudomonadota bacterium]
MAFLDRVSLFWCLHKHSIGITLFVFMSVVLALALSGFLSVSNQIVVGFLYVSNLFVLMTLFGNTWQRISTAEVILPARRRALETPSLVAEDKVVEKSAFVAVLDQFLKFRAKDGLEVGTIFCDVDLFKQINDTYGHPVGDAIIKTVGERLRRAVRQQDVVARMGGDEFAVVLPGIEDDMQVLCIADRVMRSFSEPVDALGNEIYVSLTMGISISDETVVSADELLARSDSALLLAKSVCRGTIHFFDKNMEVEEQTKRKIEEQLRLAARNGEFSLAYQPAIDGVSHQPVYLESGLRWTNPALGEVPPEKFLPVAEASGLMQTIGMWMLEQAYEAVRALDAAGWTEARIAVNISQEQLKSSTFALDVLKLAEENYTATRRITLEVHEDVLADDRFNMQAKLGSLRDMGFQVCLDEFGTGNASIGMVRRAKFDAVKVSRRLVREIPDKPEMRNLVSAITELGRSMNVTVLAEGVENREIWDEVLSLRFNALQGSAICAAKPLEELLQTNLVRPGCAA